MESLRHVGLEQLSMQSATAGSFDTLVGGILTGAGALAAVDVALHGRHAPLVAAGLCAAFGMFAALPRRPQNGPTIPEMLAMRLFADEDGTPYLLADDDVEWLVIGDIEKTVRNNEKTLRVRWVLVGAAIVSLLFGLGALARDEYAATDKSPGKSSASAKRPPSPPCIYYNGHNHVSHRRRWNARSCRAKRDKASPPLRGGGALFGGHRRQGACVSLPARPRPLDASTAAPALRLRPTRPDPACGPYADGARSRPPSVVTPVAHAPSERAWFLARREPGRAK